MMYMQIQARQNPSNKKCGVRGGGGGGGGGENMKDEIWTSWKTRAETVM